MHNVVVTGGSRGIGLAIARRLAAAGYNVIAVARRESGELNEAIREAAKQGTGGLHFKACDLSEIDAIPSFVKSLRDEFGAIYGLVNNAGIGTEGLLATMHNTEIEAVINRRAEVRMSRARSRRSPITGSIVVADVILADDVDASRSGAIRDEILADCRAQLAPHKIPAMIKFVPSLDITAAGKLARHDA